MFLVCFVTGSSVFDSSLRDDSNEKLNIVAAAVGLTENDRRPVGRSVGRSLYRLVGLLSLVQVLRSGLSFASGLALGDCDGAATIDDGLPKKWQKAEKERLFYSSSF